MALGARLNVREGAREGAGGEIAYLLCNVGEWESSGDAKSDVARPERRENESEPTEDRGSKRDRCGGVFAIGCQTTIVPTAYVACLDGHASG